MLPAPRTWQQSFIYTLQVRLSPLHRWRKLRPKTPNRLSLFCANRHTRISVPGKEPHVWIPRPFLIFLLLLATSSPWCLSWADKPHWRRAFFWNCYSLKNSPVDIHDGILLSHYKEWNNAICSSMDGPRERHTEWRKSEEQKYHVISLKCGI